MRNSQTYPKLLASGLLADLPEDAKIKFLDECSARHYAKPTELLVQGGPAFGLYIIAEGRIEVVYSDGDGNQALIHMAGPGEVLGEAEAVTDSPCAASCTTLPNTTVLFCPTPLIYEQIRSPVFVRNLMTVLYERLMRDNKYRNVTQFYSVDQRLCIYLCELTSVAKPEVMVSQAYLAGAIGCSRQTMNRKLAELRDEGLISLAKGAITVINRDRLQSRVNELL